MIQGEQNQIGKRIFYYRKPRRTDYLMLSNWATTRTTAKAVWMEKCSHASQIIAIAYFTFASIAYPASIHEKNTWSIKFKIVKVTTSRQAINFFCFFQIIVTMVTMIFDKSSNNYTEINMEFKQAMYDLDYPHQISQYTTKTFGKLKCLHYQSTKVSYVLKWVQGKQEK